MSIIIKKAKHIYIIYPSGLKIGHAKYVTPVSHNSSPLLQKSFGNIIKLGAWLNVSHQCEIKVIPNWGPNSGSFLLGVD